MSKPYVLGHTTRELDRLDLQGIIYKPLTRRALLDGGLQAGMRVLDVGCGSGDVSRLAGEIVGEAGSVLGVDLDEGSVQSARERTSLPQVSFQVSEASAVAEEGAFDALIGRFILMHQPDPAAFLAQAAQAVRPGGRVIFVESHMAAILDGEHSFPYSALYDKVIRWKCDVVAAAGADIRAGLALHSIFQAADLPAPQTHMETAVSGGANSVLYRYMADSIRSMLPMAAKYGITGFDEATVKSLEGQLRDELVASGGVFVCWPAVAAWCQLPEDGQ
ncbi:MAG: methyltransferase domain-containing protein [Chloroflexota bacterium]